MCGTNSTFNLFYGLKELHSREDVPPGDSLIISPTEQYNGCYGWMYYPELASPPFITVAGTGSIGEAFVQLESCAVNDDCLILLPKNNNLSLANYFICAAVIRAERWRFTYGRKLTPARICDFKMPHLPQLEKWTTQRLAKWKPIWNSAISLYSGFVSASESEEFAQQTHFESLLTKWKDETAGHSSPSIIRLNDNYLRIIAMGESAIPLLFQKLEKYPINVFHALRILTGANPVKPEEEGNMKKMIATWLKWGRDNNYIV